MLVLIGDVQLVTEEGVHLPWNAILVLKYSPEIYRWEYSFTSQYEAYEDNVQKVTEEKVHLPANVILVLVGDVQ